MVAKSKMFSLDNYEAEAEKEYRSYQIRVDADTVVKLFNPLRVSEEKRARLFELIPQMAFEGEEATADDLKRMQPLINEIFTLVGDENVVKLLARVGGDLSITMKIFQDYFKEIGLGEASDSES